eukprot:7385118-Pyramimonas_sp.AAC.1
MGQRGRSRKLLKAGEHPGRLLSGGACEKKPPSSTPAPRSFPGTLRELSRAPPEPSARLGIAWERLGTLGSARERLGTPGCAWESLGSAWARFWN